MFNYMFVNFSALTGSRGSSDVATDWTTGVRFPAGVMMEFFFLRHSVRSGTEGPPTEWVPGALALKVKRPGP
jgi:hypothetical protein